MTVARSRGTERPAGDAAGHGQRRAGRLRDPDRARAGADLAGGTVLLIRHTPCHIKAPIKAPTDVFAIQI